MVSGFGSLGWCLHFRKLSPLRCISESHTTTSQLQRGRFLFCHSWYRWPTYVIRVVDKWVGIEFRAHWTCIQRPTWTCRFAPRISIVQMSKACSMRKPNNNKWCWCECNRTLLYTPIIMHLCSRWLGRKMGWILRQQSRTPTLYRHSHPSLPPLPLHSPSRLPLPRALYTPLL